MKLNSVGIADPLSDHFDSKQSSESVDLPLIWYPSPSFIIFAFWSSEVTSLSFHVDPYCGTENDFKNEIIIWMVIHQNQNKFNVFLKSESFQNLNQIPIANR